MHGANEPGFTGARRGIALPAGLAFIVAALLVTAAGGQARAQDTTAPTLLSYSVSPAIVDVTGGPASALVTARFTDDLSGFESASLLYVPPAGFVTFLLLGFSDSDRISGDALDGVYQTTFQVAEFEKAGTWTVFSASVSDVAGNSTGSLPPGTEYEVVSNEDTGPPAIASFDATPTSVDVTLGDGPVTITTRITDGASGFDHGTVTLESPSTAETASLDLTAADRISGDALDGVYEGILYIPQLAESGVWTVESVRVVDAFGYIADVPASGLPGTAPMIAVTSTPDGSAPQIVSLALSRPRVDVRPAPRQVVVTLHITDDLTGLGTAGVLFQSPVTGVFQTLSFNAGDRVSGGPLDGIYERTLTLEPDSPVGNWAISVFANDPAGNNVNHQGAGVPGPGVLKVFRSVAVPSLGPFGTALLLGLLALAGSATLERRRP